VSPWDLVASSFLSPHIMAAAILSRSLTGALSGPSFLSGSKAHLLQSPAGPQCRPFVSTKPATFRCKMAETSAEPTDEDMANVGLDDVFNLIEQAERNDPSPDVPTDSRRRLTGWARWYKEFGKSLPKGVDARKALYGPDRPKWKGAFTSAADVPGYLKGQYAGDYGIDLLGFCKVRGKVLARRIVYAVLGYIMSVAFQSYAVPCALQGSFMETLRSTNRGCLLTDKTCDFASFNVAV
jgi:hypothetical protein